MQDKKETIKIALLGVIALTLIVNTYFASQKKSYSGSGSKEVQGTSTAVMNPEDGANTAMPGMANNPTPNPNLSTTMNSENPVNPVAPPSNQKATRMSFASYQHDFGKVKQESTNKYSFRFTNTGDEPLIITNAVGSCGCTVPNYPKDPIAPGKSATIDVEYKPGQQKGQQEKKVTVTANTDPAETILTIKADVLEAK